MPTRRVAAVGDGPADIGMFERAGFGVAFLPSSREVAARAEHVVERADLRLVSRLLQMKSGEFSVARPCGLGRRGQTSRQPAGQPGRPWMTRAEAIATLTLVFVSWCGWAARRSSSGAAGRDYPIRSPARSAGRGLRGGIERADVAELMLLPGVGPDEGRSASSSGGRSTAPFARSKSCASATRISTKDLGRHPDLVTLGKAAPEPPVDADYAEPESRIKGGDAGCGDGRSRLGLLRYVIALARARLNSPFHFSL